MSTYLYALAAINLLVGTEEGFVAGKDLHARAEASEARRRYLFGTPPSGTGENVNVMEGRVGRGIVIFTRQTHDFTITI